MVVVWKKEKQELHPNWVQTLPAGALKGTRTPDPLLRRQMLYPTELSAQILHTKIIKVQTADVILPYFFQKNNPFNSFFQKCTSVFLFSSKNI